jgi:NitT/TauT family transport system substrate-binding protein
VMKTQAALKRDINLATAVGRKLFPVYEAEPIARVVERDLPYYDPTISEAFVTSMNRYARDVGLLKGDPSYDDVVATRFRELWKAAA